MSQNAPASSSFYSFLGGGVGGGVGDQVYKTYASNKPGKPPADFFFFFWGGAGGSTTTSPMQPGPEGKTN